MHRIVTSATLAVALVFFVVTPAPADPAMARSVVETLHEALLGAMKEAATLGYPGRRDRLAPVIAETFDIPVIARASTGLHWREIEKADRYRLMDAMTRLTIATYAGRFDGYSGEKFRMVGVEEAPRNMVLVETELVRSNGEPVRLNYLMREGRKGWRIVDVYLDGVYSELAVRRSEYGSLIKREGLDGLLAAIEKKIAGYEAGSGN